MNLQLHNDDRVTLNGQRGFIFGIRGYCRKYGLDDAKTEAAVRRAHERRHEIAAILPESAILFGDRGAYERERQAWADATVLTTGQVVEVEGNFYQVSMLCGTPTLTPVENSPNTYS